MEIAGFCPMRTLRSASTIAQQQPFERNSDADTFGALQSVTHRKEAYKFVRPGRSRSAQFGAKLRMRHAQGSIDTNGDSDVKNGRHYAGKAIQSPQDADDFGTLAEWPSSSEQVIASSEMLRADQKLERRHELSKADQLEESNDGVEFIPFRTRHRPIWYVHKCEELGKEGKIAECVAMLEQRMLKEDRVAPTKLNFNVVLRILGHHGFTKKAFELCGKMKQYGFHVTPGIYTSLFNACANSPFKDVAIRRAQSLRERLRQQQSYIAKPTYHAMIKAFARHGELETAFQIADEMLEHNYVADVKTYSHLLSACISEKASGFKLAIEVWHRMLKRQIAPDLAAFNLLLHACNVCGLGSPEFANELLRLPLPKSQNSVSSTSSNLTLTGAVNTALTTVPFLPTGTTQHSASADALWQNMHEAFSTPLTTVDSDDSFTCIHEEKTQTVRSNSAALANERSTALSSSKEGLLHVFEAGPSFERNILNPAFRPPSYLASLANLSTPQDRFALLGGVEGILFLLKRHKVAPNCATFMSILGLIPETTVAEASLLEAMEVARVTPNVDFFNLLIRRRCFRKDTQAANAVIGMLRQHSLVPSMKTFGCLALGQRKREQGLQLLQQMKSAGHVPNSHVLFPMLTNALITYDFFYAMNILTEFHQLAIKIDKQRLKVIDSLVERAHSQYVYSQTNSSRIQAGTFFVSSYFLDGYKYFVRQYKMWLKTMQVEMPIHPWAEMDKIVDTDSLREDWEKPWLKESPRIA